MESTMIALSFFWFFVHDSMWGLLTLIVNSVSFIKKEKKKRYKYILNMSEELMGLLKQSEQFML